VFSLKVDYFSTTSWGGDPMIWKKCHPPWLANNSSERVLSGIVGPVLRTNSGTAFFWNNLALEIWRFS